MNRFVPQGTQLHGEPTRQLGVNEEPHDTSVTVDRVLAS